MSKIPTPTKSFTSEPLLVPTGATDVLVLQAQVHEKLSWRLARNDHYSFDEIEHIATLDHLLFPRSFVIDENLCNRFRRLAMFSQVGLRPVRTITSHRKIVGPVIVLLKNLTWLLVKVHLQNTMDALQELHCGIVELLAQQVVEVERLKGGEQREAGL